MYRIQVLNSLANAGLARFPAESYHIADTIAQPDAILVRSHDMHDFPLSESVAVVGRAGVGTNTIPLEKFARLGIPVMNTPGANTNAVRELVIAAMLMASRHLISAAEYVRALNAVNENELNTLVEKNKKQFAGFELRGKTLGVIGLGNIGVKVANSAAQLGMHIQGYDPAITVKNAWELSSDVRQAQTIETLLATSDFVTLHVPLIDATRGMIGQNALQNIKKGAVLLNFSRGEIVDSQAILAALEAEKISAYVNDFPNLLLKSHPRVISFPHLGASTREAEENCAVMIVNQVRNFLEKGILENAVNFPNIALPDHPSAQRIAFTHENCPGMVAQITAKLAALKMNIVGLQNGSCQTIAYTLVDVDSEIDTSLLQTLAKIEGMIRLRKLGMACQ